MKKIALLLPDFEEGGMPVVASHLLDGLSKTFEVDLIFIKAGKRVNYPTFQAKIFELEKVRKRKLGRYLQKIQSIYTFKKLRKSRKYTAVISYGILAGTINILTKNHKSKSICTIHNISSIENKQLGLSGQIFNFFLKSIYKYADHVVAISQGIQQDLVNNYRLNNVETIYNPYKFLSIRKNARLKSSFVRDNSVNFVTVSRLEPNKNVSKLIYAINELKNSGQEATLWIMGTGSEEAKLKKIVLDLKLTESIHFLGFISNPEKVVSQCDFFLLASDNEGFPNVLVESLASGTPIIVEDIYSGPREIFNDLKKTDYKQYLQEDIYIFKNGILCKDIELGMRVALDHTKFLIDINCLEDRLSYLNIALRYTQIINE